MNNTSAKKVAAVSEYTQNADDVNKEKRNHELHRQDEEQEEEEEEDIQDFSEKEEELFMQLYVWRHDTEGVARLLMSLVDVNVLDKNKNIRRQLYATVKRLLNKNASVDPSSVFGQTTLRMVSEKGHLGIGHSLVKNNAGDNIGLRSDSYNAPLLVAAEMGYEETVKALIDYDGDINAVDKNGDTLLHLAARNDLNAIVKVLLNQSAEKYARWRLKLAADKDLPAQLKLSQHLIRKLDASQIPHHAATQACSFELAKPPLSIKAFSREQAKPLHALLTAGRGYAEIVENLILKGANVNASNNDKITPLHLACQNGLSSIVEILLDNHATVDVTKQAQETPFYKAAKTGHADVVDVLLRRGICDFVPSAFKKTPLHVAVNKRHIKVVEVILKHSCRISAKLTKDEQKIYENAKKLVETRGVVPIDFRRSDCRRVSARIVCADKTTPLELMLESLGYTALELAVISSQPKLVKILLSVDPCLYSEKDLGNSFRCMIKTIGLWEDDQYKFLMQSRNIMEGLCVDIEHKIYCKNTKDISHVLVNSSKFNVNSQDDKLNTLLHEAIKHWGDCFDEDLAKQLNPRILGIQTMHDVIQLLLEKGADFNMKNAFGETPLIIASEKGCSHAIPILFDWEQKSGLKLELDARDQYGATALIKAAETHHVSVMRLLLNHEASVDLQDYYGFTALHAAVYEPNRNLFDLHFFCKGLIVERTDISRRYDLTWREKTVDSRQTIMQVHTKFTHDRKTTRLKEEMVKLLLAIDETNVNAIDFRGNTPLDLAVKSSKRITSETFKVLENCGAIRNLLESIDEAPIEVARVDERGRSPLHRLIISQVSDYAVEDKKAAKRELNHERFDLMVHGIILKPENFSQSANETDDKGRTPLHYAVMPTSYTDETDRDLVSVLLEIGSNVNAADIYGKTPLHYAEMIWEYDLLVKYGAVESTKDKYGHSPRDLRQLRESVTINTDKAKELLIGKKEFFISGDLDLVPNTDHVTELSKRKLVETVKIHSQTRRPKESSEEAIWKVWIQSELFSLNRRVSQLEPSIQRLIERLADGIKEKDWRFECQPILVGSANEETKSVISGDFDFNFRLIKFSQLCDVFPHPLGPKGYFQLRRKRDKAERRPSDEEFDCFFNLDQCLLTNEVNSRFHIFLENILHEPSFWQDEHLFEWNVTDIDKYKSEKQLCKTVRIRMIHPIDDGEGGFIFVNVSIDVVACVQVEDSWLRDQLSVAIGLSAAGKADGCTLVFDRPRFDPSKQPHASFIFSDTFAKISFAPQESRVIRESSSVIKAAYIVCKLILCGRPKTTYQLKTSVLFCMEALNVRQRCERKGEDKITKKELAFWVERIMFCFMEFYRHDVYPCYFMPSFRQQVVQLYSCDAFVWCRERNCQVSLFQYSDACGIYLDLCPDDTDIHMPIVQHKYTHDFNEGGLNANQDPKWEQFDREEFIGKLSSRNYS